MDTATQIQILAETVCISHSTNTNGESMNLIIFPLAVSKIAGQTGLSLTLVW